MLGDGGAGDAVGVALRSQSTGSADSYVLRPVVFTIGSRDPSCCGDATEYAGCLPRLRVAGRRIRDLRMTQRSTGAMRSENAIAVRVAYGGAQPMMSPASTATMSIGP